MKKLFLISLALISMTAAHAQLKVIPTLKKGMEKVYVTKGSMILPGQPEMAFDTESKFSVSDATAEGYVIDMITTSFNCAVSPDNITGQIVAASQEMIKDINVRVATDKNGKPLKIMNYDELSKVLDTHSKQMIDKLYQLVPQIKTNLSEDVLKAQLMESVTEEALLKSMTNTASPMLLFGKTVMTGSQEDITNEQGIKMKRMYFVNGKNVTANATINMSKEDIKNLIIAQIEKMAPDQAKIIKENIDQLMDTGMLKIDFKETATYELQDDNWPKTLTIEIVNEAAGQKTINKSISTLK